MNAQIHTQKEVNESGDKNSFLSFCYIFEKKMMKISLCYCQSDQIWIDTREWRVQNDMAHIEKKKNCCWHFDIYSIVGSDSSKKQRVKWNKWPALRIFESTKYTHTHTHTCNLNHAYIVRWIDIIRTTLIEYLRALSICYREEKKNMFQLFLYHEHLWTVWNWINLYIAHFVNKFNGYEWIYMSIEIAKISTEFFRKRVPHNDDVDDDGKKLFWSEYGKLCECVCYDMKMCGISFYLVVIFWDGWNIDDWSFIIKTRKKNYYYLYITVVQTVECWPIRFPMGSYFITLIIFFFLSVNSEIFQATREFSFFFVVNFSLIYSWSLCATVSLNE